jgi:hypothetical protein
MSKSKYKHSTLSGLVESDPEDSQFIERDAMPTPDSAAENRVPGKKARGRPKAGTTAKVTKAPVRRTSGRLNAKLKAVEPPKGKRKALADRTNQQYASDTEEVDDFEHDGDAVMREPAPEVIAGKETKAKAMKKKAPARGKPAKAISTDTKHTLADTPQAHLVERRRQKEKPAAKQQIAGEASAEKIILESQAPVMDVDGDEQVEQTVPQLVQNSSRPRSYSRPRQHSVQRRRAGSASDTERNDPALRRKLGEMTKKYESLNVKYQDLREIGLKEAERNFERLKKQSEEKTAGK